MKQITFLFTVMLMAVVTSTFAQGVTKSSINGKITDNLGDPLPGANVVAIHGPSGTKYGAITDFDGFYRIANMRSGGPYRVTISYVGFQGYLKDGVFLQLGDSQDISAQLQEEANALEEVVITATNNGVFDSGKTGAATNVDRKKVNTLPSISRNIADFARLTPQAQVSGDDVISISGQNNRYNAIYIDGAVNNDVFGLAGSGTNGGQTGVSPISLDAIESFQINVAPFDVKQSGFSGGSINAITKSGTNNIEGSAYYLLRNQDLAGKTPEAIADGGERTKLADFNAETYGLRVGGPIIKDKLFYFVNYERQDNETPQPFEFNSYRGASSQAEINALSDFLKNTYGYDPGVYDNNTSSLISDKLIAKIDWNINDNNNLSLKHSYVRAEQLDANGSNGSSINFLNRAINFESVTNSTALELSSRFNNKVSNNLVVGYTSVKDDRGPNGDPFPSVQIFDGSSSIFFGSEPFSTANLLDQTVFTFTDNLEIYSGRHTITLGTSNEFSSANNVFFRQNFGDYRYSNINDFINGEKPNRYRRGYSLQGGFGDDSEGAAKFNVFQLGFYAQDEVNITDNFVFTAGLRIDLPYWEDGLENEDFNTRSVALLEASGKDLKGARVGKGIDTKAHLSPRLGFNWDVNGTKTTQVRGGLGIFTSRLPLVWPGATYTNNGVTAGFVELFRDDAPFFEPNVNNQFTDPLPGSGTTGGQVDLFAANFKLPQVMKYNIAFDQKLPTGFTLSADFIYNDNITAVSYENLNLPNPEFTTTGAGSRPNYGFNRIDSNYSGIFLASNTGKGSSYNVSATLGKNFYSSLVDVTTQATYSYGDSDGVFDGESSQNSSQWQRLESVNGSNRPGLSTSDFSPGHRIVANSTIEFKWNENLKTRIGIFYQGSQGDPFSYVYGNSPRGGGPSAGQLIGDTGNNTALIFVPATQADANLVDLLDDEDNLILTSQQQWNALNSFIEGNDYLRSRRGTFAERNGDRAEWSHIVDLKFAQEFSINAFGKKNTLEFTADIFNFTNLLNKEWGVRSFAGSFDAVNLLNFEGFETDGTTPTFSYDPDTERDLDLVDDSGLNSSRWQMQIGLRYTFN
ncbi:carboxypeptidase regulatory-like domain-containing protein [Aquimarina sp. W85]|uniref:TonB-dependent receptor n=1 Tax=Aquimarina rhodophyticola TaxID=3342246 RepID=UPI00366E024B